MRPSAALWSTTTLVVSGSFLPLAMSDSRRSTRKMMSIGVPSWHGRVGIGARGDYGTRRTVSACEASRQGRGAAAGTIAETSPPKRAISLTRLELT